MKQRFLIILFLFFFSSLSYGQKEIALLRRNIKSQLLRFPQEKIHLQNDKPEYLTGEKIWFRIYVADATTLQPAWYSRYIYVELISPENKIVGKVKIHPDELNNLFFGYLPIEEHLPSGYYYIRAYTKFLYNTGTDFFFNKRINVLNPKDDEKKVSETQKHDYDVKFFPEGGNLLEGISCKVAFKAVNENGLNEIITGIIIDENDEKIAAISTIHDGMGLFELQPVAGKKYFLECQNSRGEKKRFALSEAHTDKYSLAIDSRGEEIRMEVHTSPSNTEDNILLLLVHNKGKVEYISWLPIKERNVVILDKLKIQSGINQVLLLDHNLNPLSERLFFVNGNDDYYSNIIISSDKPEYHKREHVCITTKIDSIFHGGNYSVSVIDGNDIAPDTTSTILTTMLLTSELKGYIENPSFYFEKDSDRANLLDLLMMTHGWRRYNMPEVLKGNIYEPKLMPEMTQQISGTAYKEKTLKNTPLQRGSITLLNTQDLYGDATTTDEQGHFVFKGFEFPDSTQYIIQAVTEKGKTSVELILDEEGTTNIADDYPKMPIDSTNGKSFIVSKTYHVKADSKYTMENGMREINLGEIEVVAEVSKKKKKSVIYQDPIEKPNATRNAKFIEERKFGDVASLLRNMGMKIVRSAYGALPYFGNSMSMFNAHMTAAIIVDDVVKRETTSVEGFSGQQFAEPGFNLNSINIRDVESVTIIEATNSILGTKGAYGAVAFTLKRGGAAEFNSLDYENKKIIIPLGYQKYAEFYSPKYETRKQKENGIPDFRTTIYWKPDVMISDNGEAEFDFYTADSPSIYSIVIEGITKEGKLIHKLSTITVK